MKKYISPGSCFSLEYPDNWCEFEDSEDCFLFYNPDKWTGNFRISAYRGNSSAYANECLEDELHQVRGAKKVKVGSWDCVYSSESFQENGVWYTTHIWVTGRGEIHRSQGRDPQGWRSYCSFPEGAQCIRQTGEGSNSGPYSGN